MLEVNEGNDSISKEDKSSIVGRGSWFAVVTCRHYDTSPLKKKIGGLPVQIMSLESTPVGIHIVRDGISGAMIIVHACLRHRFIKGKTGQNIWFWVRKM